MAISRQKKETILKDLNEQFDKARMVVFVNFHGLGTAATRKLRTLARASSGKYLVAKKTLIKKALEKSDLSGAAPSLEGEVGLIFASGENEIVNLAKNLVKFIKEHKELAISGGVFENRFIVPTTIVELSAIPSREALLAKLVYVINAPRQGLVVTLNGAIRNFVSVLSQIKK